MIKLIFALEEENRRMPSISAAIPEVATFADKLQATASAGKQLGLKLKNKSGPALRKRVLQVSTLCPFLNSKFQSYVLTASSLRNSFCTNIPFLPVTDTYTHTYNYVHT